MELGKASILGSALSSGDTAGSDEPEALCNPNMALRLSAPCNELLAGTDTVGGDVVLALLNMESSKERPLEWGGIAGAAGTSAVFAEEVVPKRASRVMEAPCCDVDASGSTAAGIGPLVVSVVFCKLTKELHQCLQRSSRNLSNTL